MIFSQKLHFINPGYGSLIFDLQCMKRTPIFFNFFILSPWNKKLSDVIIQINKLFMFRDLLNFITKCIGGQIKPFSFLFCTAVDVKSTKGGEY